MAKQGKQTESDKLRRHAIHHRVASMDDKLHLENTSPFLLFMVVFLRYDFGHRYLKGVFWRVWLTIFWFCVAAYVVGSWFTILPAWLTINYQSSIGIMGILGLVFTAMFWSRKLKIRLYKLRRFEVYSWSSGKPYLIGFGKWWIRQLNKGSVRVQKAWNATLSKDNKFEPRKDYYWNDVGATRKYAEPFVALVLTVIFFVLGQPIVAIWFLICTLVLRWDAGRFIKDYNTDYDNLQDMELVTNAKAEILDDDFSQELRHGARTGDFSGALEEMEKKEKEFEERMERQIKSIRVEDDSHLKNPAPPADDFSLDDAFDELHGEDDTEQDKKE